MANNYYFYAIKMNNSTDFKILKIKYGFFWRKKLKKEDENVIIILHRKILKILR